MRRLDSATTLRYAQNDNGHYCCRFEVKIESVAEYQRLAHLNVAEFQRFCDQAVAVAKKPV